jgi:hypothetical protein
MLRLSHSGMDMRKKAETPMIPRAIHWVNRTEVNPAWSYQRTSTHTPAKVTNAATRARRTLMATMRGER